MKKDNRLYTVLFVLFVVLLALPWVQMKTQMFKIPPLKGSFNVAEKKPLTWDTYRDGSYQQAAEDYLSDHFGFREWAFRTYNQYLWSCYGIWNTTCIRLGQDHWLYYLDDVNDYYYGLGCYENPDSTATRQLFEQDAREAYWLQEVLKEYGVNFFVCMAPSKSMTFPEHIANPIPNYSCNHPKAYPFYVDRFAQLGVNAIDYNAYFARLKGHVDYPLYYKFSSHWTNLAVCYMGDTLLRYMEHLGGTPLPHLRVGPEYTAAPREPDDDMVGVVNVWWPIERQTYRYADVSIVPGSGSARPRLLAVGDSYCKSLHNILPFDTLFSQYHYWYYYHDIERDTNHDNVDQVDVLDELLGSDYVMLIWCPINIYKLGHGFLSRALVELCIEDHTLGAAFRAQVVKIQDDAGQMAAMEQKARDNGWRLNEAITKEAYDRLYNHPEKYFSALQGYGIPVTRNSRIALMRGGKELSADDRRRGEIYRMIYNDRRWTQYVRRKAEETLTSHQAAMRAEVEQVLRHPDQTPQQSAVKDQVIAIYTYEPCLQDVYKKWNERKGYDLDEAVWAEARERAKDK